MFDLNKIIRALIYISPFFYPAYFLQFSVAGIPFTVLEAFCYLLFGMWLISVITGKSELVWDKTTKKYWYGAFFIIIGVTLGVIAAPSHINLPSGEMLNAKRVALGVWKGWVMAPMLYFAVLSQFLKTRSDTERLSRSYIYSAAVIGIISHILGLFADGITVDLRLRGFYESANYLALFIVPAILLNIYFVVKHKETKKIIRYFDVASLTVLLYTLFFTQSYAGIIAVFGSLGLSTMYYLFKEKKHRKKLAVSVIALFIIFAGVVLSQVNSPKFRQALDYKNRSSTSVRLEIYRTSVDLIKMHPFFGFGPGLFQANYQNQAPITLQHAPLEWNMPHPHNVFLAFWMNAGLVGLIAFILILIFAHQKFTYPLIALWGILIHGLFDMPFWKNDLAMIFWLVIACILVMQKVSKTEGTIS